MTFLSLLQLREVVVGDVRPQWNGVLVVVGEQTEPFGVTSFVEQVGFPIEEIGDFGLKQQLLYRILPRGNFTARCTHDRAALSSDLASSMS